MQENDQKEVPGLLFHILWGLCECLRLTGHDLPVQRSGGFRPHWASQPAGPKHSSETHLTSSNPLDETEQTVLHSKVISCLPFPDMGFESSFTKRKACHSVLAPHGFGNVPSVGILKALAVTVLSFEVSGNTPRIVLEHPSLQSR